MANELTVAGSLTYSDATGVSDQMSFSFTVTPGTLKIARFKQTIATSETALKLGDISSPGYTVIQNKDATNYVDVKVGTSGAIFARLKAASSDGTGGGACLVALGSGAQAPYLVANSASCVVDVLIVSV